MSVVGLDVGNENCIIGVARQRGIDVVLNDECGRETPSMVSFSDKQRYIGTAAASTATMNPKNTISQIKRLIGRNFRDPEVQKDLHLFSFSVSEGADGGPLINVNYLGERASFTPTQILAMILFNIKTVAEKALGMTVADCVVGIPAYFSELQRRAYLDAATIAGLRPLRLMHETTATALAYGIYKPDLPPADNEPLNVVFVDVGHATMQVCVAAFRKGQLKVLGQAFDRCLGGRDFDEVLFKHFADKFKKEYSINVLSNVRASQRLRSACEKMKKVLSANAEAPLNIECLMDEKDVKGHIRREEFEDLARDLLERVKIPCEKALADSGLPLEKIGAVEVVGSGSRVPAILKIIASFFRKEPSRTLNASECIARGCTLQCAMMSPTFKVRHFEVQDSFPFPIALSWKGPSASKLKETPESGVTTRSIVFVKGNILPNAKLLTFQRSGTFSIDALYADGADLPPGTPLKISTYQIGPCSPCKLEQTTLKIKIRLNIHGIFSVELATLIQEEESKVPASELKDSSQELPEPLPVETGKQGQNVGRQFEGGDLSKGENFRTPECTESNSKNEQDGSQPEVGKKKKTIKTDIPVQEVVLGGLPSHELQKAMEKEFEMALQDRVMEETKEKKNAVEAYIYDMRNKLSDTLQAFVTERELEELAAVLQQTEFWLYEEGEDEPKGVYVAKLAELKKLGDPLLERQREDEARGQATEELLSCIKSYSGAAQSKDAKYDHICSGDKEKVLLECKKAEEWLKVKKQPQDALAKTELPVLLAVDIKMKLEALEKFCKTIMDKTRPISPEANTETCGEQKKGDNMDSCCGDPNGCSNTREEEETSAKSKDVDKVRSEGESMHTD